jgi:hypothetical protein
LELSGIFRAIRTAFRELTDTNPVIIWTTGVLSIGLIPRNELEILPKIVSCETIVYDNELVVMAVKFEY